MPTDILSPRKTWPDSKAYDEQAKKLAGMFRKNFGQFADGTTAQVANAGPRADT
ncbi:MAG: hypothetical protein WBE26_08330 [Phycisphaerae bacterium]